MVSHFLLIIDNGGCILSVCSYTHIQETLYSQTIQTVCIYFKTSMVNKSWLVQTSLAKITLVVASVLILAINESYTVISTSFFIVEAIYDPVIIRPTFINSLFPVH